MMLKSPESDSMSPSPVPSRWHGQLQLEFVADRMKTQLSHRYAQAPLKIQRPFYPEPGGVCHAAMLHTAGGIAEGDRLSMSLRLHPQAQAVVTTPAATKVYRSTGGTAEQQVSLTVEAGACLEWLPQEVIVFEGARFRQGVRVELGEGAIWLGWDLIRLGRSARGERFQRGEWRSHLEIWQQGRPLWIDPQRVVGGSDVLTSAHGLAGCPVIGSFAVVGAGVPQRLVDEARSQIQTLAIQGDCGLTRLQQGMLCRYRGHSTREARQWFTAVWDLARLSLLQRQPCHPRLWAL
ncbi:MAG: urease accessory protein UreD [Synechococcales bacterium]|nr:urease accessory protein UreD [Synechococcales bacterium]